MTTSPSRPYDAIGIGASVWDTLLVLPEYPAEDSKLAVDEIAAQGGGPTATAIVAMARLGLNCAYLGCVGSDLPGRAMIDDFVRYGVSTEHLAACEGKTSTVATILVNAGRGTRTILHKRGTAPAPDISGPRADALRGCRLLHVEGRYGEVDLEAARIVRRSGGRVSLDAGSPHPGIGELMKNVDLLIASEPFALLHTGEDAPDRAAAALMREYSPAVAVVTTGARGGVCAAGNGVFGYPAYEVEVADTTGAGDVFHGAFAYAHLKGWSAGRCCRFASATAALKCTRVGGRAGIPALDEVQAFLSGREG